ncbi:MAG: hypothetical protein IJU40_01480, partial [Desulfovibrionaceae bacterium]|nr:hypothetical protein [Desulfovibrionaceae bacterium]
MSNSELQIKFKKLTSLAATPQKGSQDAAGFDLTATSKTLDPDNNCIIYGTGIAVAIPTGYVG